MHITTKVAFSTNTHSKYVFDIASKISYNENLQSFADYSRYLLESDQTADTEHVKL